MITSYSGPVGPIMGRIGLLILLNTYGDDLYMQGRGDDFFLGGGSVDMPSDCQNLGGHRHIHPIETKSWGGELPPLPPPSAPAPLSTCIHSPDI